VNYKLTAISIVAVFAPGVPELMKEFQSQSPYLAAFVVSGTSFLNYLGRSY
jgi:hypothetical protein